MSELDPRLHAFRPDLADEALRGRVEAARFVAARPAQVARGSVALRRRPEATAPQDTELLSGERVRVFEEADGWAWLQNEADGYVGYVEAGALGADVVPTSHSVKVLRTFLYPESDLKVPPLGALTMTGRVAVRGTRGRFSEVRLGGAAGGWVYSAHLAPDGEVAPDYVATALEFVGVPYLWGGKSSLGLDCSGLVQVVLARAGIACPRDTYVQARALGAAVPWRAGESRPRRGDIVFFPGHVAIALDAEQVVNANAQAMLVSVEPLAALEARVKAESNGTGITVVRRPAQAG